MIQVLLITQSDCIGCEIMTDIILSIKKTYDDNKNININICNKDFIDRNILKENNITDFPATIIYDDNYKKSITFLGTIPFIQIQKEIDNIKYYKNTIKKEENINIYKPILNNENKLYRVRKKD